MTATSFTSGMRRLGQADFAQAKEVLGRAVS